MINDKVYFLSKVELLSDLTFLELNELSENFHWEHCAQGSAIIRQGQRRHPFYVLVEGNVEVIVNKKGVQGNQLCPGDSFGEIALFTGKPAPFTLRCLENCKLLALDPEDFARMLVHWPKLYQKFIENLSIRLNQVNIGLWEAKHKELLRSSLKLTEFQRKFYGIWGNTKTTSEVENKLTELSQTKENLLVIGERGTGRQMLVWYLHKRQFGESAPFIVVDGQHFDQQWGDLVFETHSGEDQSSNIKSSGLLDLAEGGTLFIREINLISPRAQQRLVIALQSHDINCRVIGSLKAEPESLPQQLIPQLRQCFMQTYNITPLRERKKDIPVLAQGILETLARQHNRKTPVFDKQATKLMLTHNYRQGNVTELIQVVERAFFLTEDEVIGIEHLYFGPAAEKIGRSINLLSWDWIDKLVRRGIFPLWPQRVSAAIFLFIILLMFIAPETRITAILFLLVWSLWWPALTIISPFLGRVWCGICPFSYVMQQVQKVFHLNRPVPEFLKKYDYLLITFLFIFVFWIEAITGMRFNPMFTALWLLSVLLAASIIGLIYTRHTWCKHLCPLGGFVGVASIGGLLEVRADATVCLNKCTTYECYHGKGDVPGCPMSQYVPFVDSNLACKLCLQCARNCPNGAVKINLRIPAREVWHLVRVNQGFTIFVGVALAVLIPIHYFEPLREVWSLGKWRLWFTIVFWGTALIAGFVTWLIARPFKTKAASKRVKLVFALIPLVLSGYIIYQLHYLPGINWLDLGLVYTSPGGSQNSLYVPLLTIWRYIAALIGIILTSITIFMVIYRTKKKSSKIE